MPALLIKDFLQTQGIRLPIDEVRVAYLAAQAVINMGNASIDHAILWYQNDEGSLMDFIEKNPHNETLLKQIFMALDSVASRAENIHSVSVYAHMPSENLTPQLVRLSHQGLPLEQLLPINEETVQTHLACRTAQTGWMNIANDIAYWLELAEIKGERNHKSGSQLSIPICTLGGKVLGVIQVEFTEKNQATEAAQTDWIALSLALIEPLKMLLNVEDENEE